MPGFPNPIDSANFAQLMDKLLSIFQEVAIVALAVVLVYAGYTFATAEGQPQKLESAKKAIFWAVVGAGIIFLAKPLVNMLVNIIS